MSRLEVVFLDCPGGSAPVAPGPLSVHLWGCLQAACPLGFGLAGEPRAAPYPMVCSTLSSVTCADCAPGQLPGEGLLTS